MSRPELSTVQHVILCCLAWRGPLTPYQLKDYVSRVVSWVWEFPHAQLYTEPARLAEMGLVVEEREEAGRRRRTYTITAEGLDVVRTWLAEPPTKPPQLRDLGMLKLHFSALSDPESVRGLAEHQQRVTEERLSIIRAGMLESDVEPERRRFVRTGARLAMTLSEITVEFWRDVAADPDRRIETTMSGEQPFRPRSE